MKKDLTQGNVTSNLLLFAGPMILGNLLQQFYNIADTLVVGRVLGPDALAAVGSAYTLMTFLTSILIGMAMGSGALFSYYFGRKEEARMKSCMRLSFLLIGGVTVALNLLVMAFCRPILRLLQTPPQLMEMMHSYVWIIFTGLVFVFLYNYFAYLLRAVGNSVVPLYFLGSTALLNIILDLVFVIVFRWGIAGAAAATVMAQAVSGIGLMAYTWIKEPKLRFHRRERSGEKASLAEILRFAFSSSVQQSVMNFGILMIQGLVNSFGPVVMAAFAAAVKIDSFAYMPAQEFGNAFSLFISQNHGAGREDRVKLGMKSALKVSMAFCLAVSLLIFLFAPYLMMLFVSPGETEIIAVGVGYLQIEGAFYCGIGILFLLYGYYRGINRPEMSLVLTVISLGTRVLLAYLLAPLPGIGVYGIWSAIPIGWILADAAGLAYMRKPADSRGKSI
ncbi:MAG: MATE family efflux transporter [Lachnospiraceae bacterium]|nr:MATE family efflux transporter [Lachnospiraceae bacterium]